MKKLLFLALIAFFAAPAFAQETEKAKWAELDAFHEVMSKTFHPSEEGKLDPIKARSAEMVDKAVAWSKSKAPAGYNKNAVKDNLKELVKGAKELNKLVQDKATDDVLKAKLKALHEVFHGIVEKCEAEESEHERH